MDELFGVPTNQLTLVLLGVFAAEALILASLAARDRISFRMAVRNLPRRKAQSVLIVTGLMLATMLFSAAFTTGDTLTNSLRAQALENIGRVDVVVRAKQPESGSAVAFGPGAGVAQAPEARERYFDAKLADEVCDRLADEENVAGVAPLAKESVPVTAPKTDLSEPRVDVLGIDANSMRGFDRLRTASGTPLALGDLKKNEVYVGTETAEGLGIGVGDRVEVSLIQPPSKPQSKQRLGKAQGRPRGQEARMPPAEAQSGERPPGSTDDVRPAGSEVETRPAKAKSKERSPEFAV